VPELFAVIVQVPRAIIVSDPVDALTEQIAGVADENTIVPVFAGLDVAVTEWVPATSAYATPVGTVPKLSVRALDFPTVTVAVIEAVL